MKHSLLIVCCALFFCACSNGERIKLNEIQTEFSEFPTTDSLKFTSISDSLLEESSKLLLYGDTLIVQEFNRAHDEFLTFFSIETGQVIKKAIPQGAGPEELLNCDICLLGNELWMYDMGKIQVGKVPMDSLLNGSLSTSWYKLDRFYYRFAMLNDSTMLGTNDLSAKTKIAYVNLETGQVVGRSDYAYLDEEIGLAALIDACSCYIDVNPRTKDIALSYRYMDVLEIYDAEGHLKSAIQGPACFDVDFQPRGSGMGKTEDTRKAFVNSYATENAIYLLYSGNKRTEENWAYGSEIFVYSWDGTPLKRYLLDRPVYTFAVDETKKVIYSYSLKSDELVKGQI